MKKTKILLLILSVCCLLTACKKYNQAPTEPPLMLPTQAPTEAVTEAPTEVPTEIPTGAPTQAPIEMPTEAPTEAPTEIPTEIPTEAPVLDNVTTGDMVAALAAEQLGKPYGNAAAGPDAFDVSGLLYYCFREFDIKVPRTTKELGSFGEEVERADLLPGDAVFFYNADPGTIQYCGIYIGDGKFVAARNSEHPVSEMDLNGSYFSQRYITARRFWE